MTAAAPRMTLIADGQTMVRESFAAILAAQPGITAAVQAGDGAQAVSQARRLRPDVVLLDVRMPVMNGLAAAVSCCPAASRVPAC